MSARPLLALLTCSSVACAAGPDVDEDLYDAYYVDAATEAGSSIPAFTNEAPLSATIAHTSSALNLDAGVYFIDAAAYGPVFADAGLPVDAAIVSSPHDSGSPVDAATQLIVDAGTSGRNAASAPSCSPATCTNNCLLLSRCCTADNQCACETLLSHQCIVPSF